MTLAQCLDAVLDARSSFDRFKGLLALLRMNQMDRWSAETPIHRDKPKSLAELRTEKSQFLCLHACALNLVALTKFHSAEAQKQTRLELLGLKYAFDNLILPKGI